MSRVNAVESLARCVALGDDVDGALSRLEEQFQGTTEEAAVARLASAVARINPLLAEHAALQEGALDPVLEALELLAREQPIDVQQVLDGVARALASLDEAPPAEDRVFTTHEEPEWSGLIAEDDLVLLPEFVLEAREQLGAAEQQLLFLERSPGDSNALNTAFRGLHTVKGVAACLGITPIAELSHELETLLDRARQNMPLDQVRMTDVVMRGIDRLRRLVEWLAPRTSGAEPHGERPRVADILAEARAVVASAGAARPQPTWEAQELSALKRSPSENLSALSKALGASLQSERSAPASGLTGIPIVSLPVGVPVRSIANSAVDPFAAELGTPGPSILGGMDQAEASMPASERLPAWAPPGNKRPRAQDGGHNAAHAPSTVKVDTRKLDALMDLVGELVVTQSMVTQDPDLATLSSQRLNQSLALLTRTCKELRRVAMSTRMVPIAATFDKMARVLRDVSRSLNKPAELLMEGATTELDRNVVETLHDPLLHMIRNSIDHGLESSAERLALGKPPAGRVTLRAYHEGGQIVVEVSDDGKGLDREKLVSRAKERGLISPDSEPSEKEAFDMIFAPGFSTADSVTDVSGRGVGMDVVKTNVERVQGRIDIFSTRGMGTTFKIRLPLTLAIVDGLMVSVAGERFIVPSLVVQEALRIAPSDIANIYGKGEVVRVRDQLLPLVRLRDKFNLYSEAVDAHSGAVVLVVATPTCRACLMIDALLGKQEVVIKSLGNAFRHTHGIAGGAILGDGRVGLILDVQALVADTSALPPGTAIRFDDTAA